LVLEVDLESRVLRGGTTVKVRYLLRNVSSHSVDVCQIDGGVTTLMAIGAGRFPVRGYGSISGSGCVGRATLRPSEAREFIEECPVPMRPGPSELWGFVRVCTPNGRDEATIESTHTGVVTITPANQALHPTPAHHQPPRVMRDR
jgi:hypothetical protein